MAGINLSIGDLATMIGLEKAVRLCDRFGGGELYIPQADKLAGPVTAGSHAIVKAVGPKAALRLSKDFSGHRLELPMAKKQVRAHILTDVIAGKLSRREAARQLYLTNRRIRQIVNEKPDARQPDLFPGLFNKKP